MKALKSKWQVRRTIDSMVLANHDTQRAARADAYARNNGFKGARGGCFHAYVSRVAL